MLGRRRPAACDRKYGTRRLSTIFRAGGGVGQVPSAAAAATRNERGILLVSSEVDGGARRREFTFDRYGNGEQAMAGQDTGGENFRVTRRTAIGAALAAAGATTAVAQPADTGELATAAKRRDAMKKSINLWAFPYPDQMSLEQCLQAGQGRRLRRHRAELRPGQRPVAQGGTKEFTGHPQDGRRASASPSAASARSCSGRIR